MDQRKRTVLRAIVEDYVSHAEPVGSRTIARKYVLGVSPATIRNEMADLEELGYLQQPHTSAGRIPSDKGYRYYVDHLMRPVDLTADELLRIRGQLHRRTREAEWVIQETARILSEITQYASVTMGPVPARRHLQSLQVLRAGEDRAVLVLVTAEGVIHHRLIDLPEEIDFKRLLLSLAALSSLWQGHSLELLSLTVLRETAREYYLKHQIIDEVLDFVESSLAEGESQKVYLGGAANILRQPEFQDVAKVRALFTLLEEEARLRELLSGYAAGLTVQIGGENGPEAVRECGLVIASYRWGLENVGQIGVLGPKRMDYARVMGVVEAVAENLSQILGG